MSVCRERKPFLTSLSLFSYSPSSVVLSAQKRPDAINRTSAGVAGVSAARGPSVERGGESAAQGVRDVLCLFFSLSLSPPPSNTFSYLSATPPPRARAGWRWWWRRAGRGVPRLPRCGAGAPRRRRRRRSCRGRRRRRAGVRAWESSGFWKQAGRQSNWARAVVGAPTRARRPRPQRARACGRARGWGQGRVLECRRGTQRGKNATSLFQRVSTRVRRNTESKNQSFVSLLGGASASAPRHCVCAHRLAHPRVSVDSPA